MYKEVLTLLDDEFDITPVPLILSTTVAGWQFRKHFKNILKTHSEVFFLCFIEILVERQISEIIIFESILYKLIPFQHIKIHGNRRVVTGEFCRPEFYKLLG